MWKLIQTLYYMKIGIGILLLFFVTSLQAQNIIGKVIDNKKQPVDGATIVLQAIDSTYINASISNVDGTFVLDSQPEEYRLIVQHLLYRTKEIEGKGRDVGVIQLDPQDYALDEVVVKAERPFVKVEEGRLGYDLSVLAGDGVVNNAYEALTKLPGVKETKGVLTLAGTGNLTVVLNGKPTTMDAGQLETLLRNTPLDRVEKAEVMYSAPPEYHVRYLDDEDHFNLAYTSSFTPEQHSNSLTSGNYQASNVDKYVETRMHNVTLQYHSGSGFDVGGDYTHYTSDNNQTLFADYADGAQSGFSIIGGQKIDRYSIYVDRKRSLAKEWDLGYGMSYRFAKDRDFQTYDKVTGDIPTENTDSRLREQTANVYVSLSKNYATGTSVSISATGEYYTIGNYRKWAVYPQASLTYVKSSEHLFQFSLSTDKTYPGYWDMQSSVSHLNGYTELWGTPGLKPSTAYNLNGNYIWKQKYIFGLFFMHTSDFFVQTGYQSTDRLALIYKNTNWNYMQMWGTNVILPFKAGNWLDSRLTLVGMQVH